MFPLHERNIRLDLAVLMVDISKVFSFLFFYLEVSPDQNILLSLYKKKHNKVKSYPFIASLTEDDLKMKVGVGSDIATIDREDCWLRTRSRW